MISVRCPACGKVIGFDESDGGSLVACPHCRQPFFVPAVARPTAPRPPAPRPAASPVPIEELPPEEPEFVPPLPPEPSLPDPDEIRIADDPDLAAIPELLDEVLPAEEPAPPPQQEAGPNYEVAEERTPAPEPEPSAIPHLELDAPQPEPEPELAETAGQPAEVKPTDLAPSLSAAAALSETLPEVKEPEPPADVLEEVRDEEEVSERFYDEEDEPPADEDEEDRPRKRKVKKDDDEEETPRPRRTAARARTKRRREEREAPSKWTRNRILGGVGAGTGGVLLLGTLLYHLTASQARWHVGVCCGDLFAAALLGAGLYFVIKG
jgi:hypothetical protein